MYTVTFVANGKEQQTQVNATEDEIRRTFERENKTILKLKKEITFLQSTKVKQDEIVAVFNSMGSMLSAGRHIPESLTALIESIKNPKSQMIPILIDIRDKTRLGIPLARCLEEYTNVFGSTAVAMVDSGERTSKLPGTLKAIAQNITKTSQINKEMIKSLQSPLLALFLVAVGMLVSSLYVIPTISKNFSKIGASSGSSDNLAITILNSMAYIMPLGIAGIFGLVVATIIFYKNNQAEAEKYIVKIPLLSEFIFFREYHQVFSTLANLLSVGFMLQDALPIVIRQTKIIIIKNELEAANRMICMGQFKRFGEAFSHITAVERLILETSERQTDIQDQLRSVGTRFYELYTDRMKMIGPVISLVIKIIVICFIILLFSAIFTPYLSMLSQIK